MVAVGNNNSGGGGDRLGGVRLSPVRGGGVLGETIRVRTAGVGGPPGAGGVGAGQPADESVT